MKYATALMLNEEQDSGYIPMKKQRSKEWQEEWGDVQQDKKKKGHSKFQQERKAKRELEQEH